MKNAALVVSILSLGILGAATPTEVLAQDANNEITRNAPVTLKTDGATLYSVLKTLFGQVKFDFTIVDSLKTVPVTVQINQPFRIALSSVLKAAGKPISYTVEDGVYHITEASGDEDIIAEPPAEDTLLSPNRRVQMRVLKVRNGSGLEIAALLGATFVPWIASFYPPYVQTNPFAQTMLGGAGFGGGGLGNGGFGGMGNNGGMGGAAMGLASGFNGLFALPGLGLGYFGNPPNQDNGGSNNGSGGR